MTDEIAELRRRIEVLEEQERIRNIEVDIKLIEGKIEGLKIATIAAALAAIRENPSLEILQTYMEIGALYAMATESRSAASVNEHMTDIVKALDSESTQPIYGWLARSILSFAAGIEMREPLKSWIAQGMPEEISDDLVQACKQLMRQSAPDHGDPQ